MAEPISANEAMSQLADLEPEFHTAEIEILKYQARKLSPLYEKRDALIEKLDGFWPTVIEAGGEELASCIDIDDLELFRSLTSLKVTRPNDDDPRDLTITFEFAANEFLDDKSLTLSKAFKFHPADGGDDDDSKKLEQAPPIDYRSSPVPIHWKGRDLTAGSNESFFDWFAWTGEPGDKFSKGDEVAIILAEEIYPNATKLYTEGMEDEDNSDEEDLEEEENGMGSGDEDQSDEEEDEDQQPPRKRAK